MKKVEIIRDEFYQVNVIKKIYIEVPDDVENIEDYVGEYLESDDGIDTFGDTDGDERWSDVQEIWYDITPENGETIQIKG